MEAAELAQPENHDALVRHLIDFDPRQPSHYRFAAQPGSKAANDLASRTTMTTVDWPSGTEPVPSPPSALDTDPLPTADVMVVTWTVAEGLALADVLSPGAPTRDWIAYRNGWPALRDRVKRGAPSLGYQRAALWMRTEIAGKQVLLVKSELHPATDGSKLPVVDLWKQMIHQVKPTLVITTGTAGGVGAQTILGDVIVTQKVSWDCRKTFANAPFARSIYTSDFPLPSSRLSTTHTKLIPVNASRLPEASRMPVIVHGTKSHPANTLSTDFFAFDDAADHYGLRAFDPHARAVEMDDAALGLALEGNNSPPGWVSVRNASDPQMNGGTLAEEATTAAHIYERYGYLTSIGSALTCWALIAPLKVG